MTFRTLVACAVFALGMPSLVMAAPELYTLDPHHTNIDWRANHFGFSNPSGKFAKSVGTLTIDQQAPQASKVDVTIDVNSLVTGIAKFDEHLKSKDFLETAKYPTARFTSTSVKLTGPDTADVTGNFTLHGVTKPIVLKTKMNKIAVNEFSKKQTAGFSATTTLKRSDFGITMAIPGVSDEVHLTIEAEGNLAEPQKATN